LTLSGEYKKNQGKGPTIKGDMDSRVTTFGGRWLIVPS
jgi:hypothetical protein